MQAFTVTSPDGLTIAGATAGNPDGPGILFIHGIFQSHLSWIAQLTDPALTAQFHLAALDLRGHGNSDKPGEKARYAEDKRWADDVAAVIGETGLKRPVLVGWSYGGRIVTDYLRHHGQEGIAGINFVAAVTRTDPSTFGPQRVHMAGMLSGDLATQIAGTRGFVRGCFERQPAQDAFETILAYNMMVPVSVRAMIADRSHNPGDVLPTIKVPVMVTHGDADAITLPHMGEGTAAMVPGATLSRYPGVGHSPFVEDALRFNRELAEFVRAANR